MVSYSSLPKFARKLEPVYPLITVQGSWPGERVMVTEPYDPWRHHPQRKPTFRLRPLGTFNTSAILDHLDGAESTPWYRAAATLSGALKRFEQNTERNDDITWAQQKKQKLRNTRSAIPVASWKRRQHGSIAKLQLLPLWKSTQETLPIGEDSVTVMTE